jgi:hypothetical protein
MVELSEAQKQAVKDIVSGKSEKTNLANGINIKGGLTGGVFGIAYAWYSGGSTIKLGIAGFLTGFIITALMTNKKLSNAINKAESDVK